MMQYARGRATKYPTASGTAVTIDDNTPNPASPHMMARVMPNAMLSLAILCSFPEGAVFLRRVLSASLESNPIKLNPLGQHYPPIRHHSLDVAMTHEKHLTAAFASGALRNGSG
jgi:hypothetical protein